ncbi:hypothetical protein [Azospirillum argentinense]|uniref:Uncharacterized protein n=1 Tax=Azospirillum brasilense TaxID=192 RepID=A0A4D8QGK4_AZOBR|nr:hypothetical protein [Azospirillum argentinense]QCO07360.1 hypothetical protein D3867_36390 [Azospirillum argentinense]
MHSTDPFILSDGTELPAPTSTRHGRSWAWAGGGYGSCSITEHRHGQALLRLVASLRDPPDHPAEPGSYDEDARRGRAADFLGRLIAHRMAEGWRLISADALSATLVASMARPSGQGRAE